MKRSRSHIKTLAHAVFCFTPLLLPLANGQVLVDDAPAIPSNKFTPPSPPKEVPPMVVNASTVTPSQTRSITLIRGEASMLPDIPPPPISKPSAPGREGEPHYIVSIGASVYDHSLSHVRWTNPETKESFEAWCGWDFTLLSSILTARVTPFNAESRSRRAAALFNYALQRTRPVRYCCNRRVPRAGSLSLGR